MPVEQPPPICFDRSLTNGAIGLSISNLHSRPDRTRPPRVLPPNSTRPVRRYDGDKVFHFGILHGTRGKSIWAFTPAPWRFGASSQSIGPHFLMKSALYSSKR